MLIQEELKKYLSYDRDTGIFIWLESRGKAKKGSIAGSIDKGYIRIRLMGTNYGAHRLAWLYETGEWPVEDGIDHEDRDKTNNKFANLKDSTNRDNSNNRDSNREITGAYLTNNKTKPWASSIRYIGVQVHLGYFKTELDAGKAYKSAENDINLGNYPVPTGLRKQGKGYYFESATSKWRANPTLNSRQVSLGRYLTEQEAINAVSKARADLLKEQDNQCV